MSSRSENIISGIDATFTDGAAVISNIGISGINSVVAITESSGTHEALRPQVEPSLIPFRDRPSVIDVAQNGSTFGSTGPSQELWESDTEREGHGYFHGPSVQLHSPMRLAKQS